METKWFGIWKLGKVFVLRIWGLSLWWYLDESGIRKIIPQSVGREE